MTSFLLNYYFRNSGACSRWENEREIKSGSRGRILNEWAIALFSCSQSAARGHSHESQVEARFFSVLAELEIYLISKARIMLRSPTN